MSNHGKPPSNPSPISEEEKILENYKISTNKTTIYHSHRKIIYHRFVDTLQVTST